MLFVQNDKKEAFESCFPDVKTWIQDSSKMLSLCAEPKGGVAESKY